MATLRVKEGDCSQYWRVLAFSESAQAELMRLGDGEAISVQGALRAELYKDGESKLSLSVIADQVLALLRASGRRTHGNSFRAFERRTSFI
jgi:hypothetical protein